MSDDWSDWIEHDGKGCPVPVGTYVGAELRGGVYLEGSALCWKGGKFVGPHKVAREYDLWSWALPDSKVLPMRRIIRYRIRRPRALEQLRQIAREVEHLTPQAGSREIAQLERDT